MGATSFSSGRITAVSMSKAYDYEYQEAIAESGNDPYNGTISTTHGFSDRTADFKRSGLSINEYIDKNTDNCQKWEDAWGIEIKAPKTNTNKVKSQVKNIVTKGAKKWVTYYVVYNYHMKVIGKKVKKADALKVAREYTERTQERTHLDLEKHLDAIDQDGRRICDGAWKYGAFGINQVKNELRYWRIYKKGGNGIPPKPKGSGILPKDI